MRTVTVSSKGQIAIPKDVRDRLRIRAGTKLTIDTSASEIRLRPAVDPDFDWRSMEGSLRGSNALNILQAERKMEHEREERKLGIRKRGR